MILAKQAGMQDMADDTWINVLLVSSAQENNFLQNFVHCICSPSKEDKSNSGLVNLRTCLVKHNVPKILPPSGALINF